CAWRCSAPVRRSRPIVRTVNTAIEETMMQMIRIAAVLLAAVLGIGAAAAQPAKSMREQLVGTWNFVIAEITAADGKKTLPFGDKPKGQIIFTADGHFSQVHVTSGLPRIASNNRLSGTDADNKAIVQGTLAL